MAGTGATAVGVAGVGVGKGTGVAAIRQRSASTVLDIGLQQRKVSVGGGVGTGVGGGPPSPGILHKRTGFNGFGGYEAPVNPNRQDILNGPGVGVGGTASSVGLTAGGPLPGRSRLSISGGLLTASSPSASVTAAASAAAAAAGAGGGSGETAGGSAPSIGGSAPASAPLPVPGPKRQGSFSNVFSKLIDGMPAGTMFAKFKSTNVAASTSMQNVAEGNPITQYFEIGKPVACAGPELVWRIHDAYRKSDNRVSGQGPPRPQGSNCVNI